MYFSLVLSSRYVRLDKGRLKGLRALSYLHVHVIMSLIGLLCFLLFCSTLDAAKDSAL
jgi:hypothetical protein